MASISTVFNTCELAHAILLELPLYDLLIATAVCKHWQHIIYTSQHIRARLLNNRTLPHTVSH